MADELHSRLREARDHRRACEVVVEHLALVRGFKPSVYLERGDRLRCQAARTYRQVLDGIPPRVGVIGNTYSRGETALVEDVAGCADYLEITPGVRAEICVPVRSGAQVIGVISVESLIGLDATAGVEVERSAALLGERLTALGGSLRETPTQRLVRRVAEFRGLSSRGAIERATLEIAREVTGMDSAALLRCPASGPVSVTDAIGPLAETLRGSSPETLAATVRFVAAGASCYTVGDRGGEDFLSLSALRAGGATGLVIMPLAQGDECRVLVIADRGRREMATDVIELLELLCSQAESALHVADLVEDLRAEAATDSLTGLGHHKAFHSRLALPSLRPTAVLVIDLDEFKSVNDVGGHLAGDRLLREVAAVLSDAVRQGDQVFRIGGDEFAAVTQVDGEPDAIELARRITAAVRDQTSITVSIGVSVDSGSGSLIDALARADRALYAAKSEGRDSARLLTNVV